MLPQPTFIPAKQRVRRKRRQAAPSAPAVALVLVAAAYDEFGATLTLAFDRAIQLVDFSGSAITVNDPVLAAVQYEAAGGASFSNPMTLVLLLAETGPATGTSTRLTATANTGIVAADDGAAWAGVTDVELPFP